MVDQNTERNVGLNIARLMVEVDMDVILPDTINLRNEKGNLIEQNVTHKWKPTLCAYCKKYGYSNEIIRKKNLPKA